MPIRHRVQFDCEEKVFDQLNALIPRGIKRYVLETICRELCHRLQQGDRADVLARVMQRQFTFGNNLYMEVKDAE